MTYNFEKDVDMDVLRDTLEVDDGYELYDEDAESARSLSSSIFDVENYHGRRYNTYRSGNHPFPRGDDLSVRNELVFHNLMLKLLDDKYHLAPVTDPRHVADVGCGLGLWSAGMAEAHPDTEVLGLDTTPQSSVLENCTFVPMDVTQEWILDRPDTKLDLVHIRGLFASIADWPNLYQHCFQYVFLLCAAAMLVSLSQSCAPIMIYLFDWANMLIMFPWFRNMASGGYIEQVEVEIKPLCDDDSCRPDSVIKQLADLTVQMSQHLGQDYNVTGGMRRLIEEAGFVECEEHRLKMPLGPWPKDEKARMIGALFESFYRTGLQGWMMKPLTRDMGVSFPGNPKSPNLLRLPVHSPTS